MVRIRPGVLNLLATGMPGTTWVEKTAAVSRSACVEAGERVGKASRVKTETYTQVQFKDPPDEHLRCSLFSCFRLASKAYLSCVGSLVVGVGVCTAQGVLRGLGCQHGDSSISFFFLTLLASVLPASALAPFFSPFW